MNYEKKKLVIVYCLTLSIAIYDKLIKTAFDISEEYAVKLGIYYFVIMYAYIIFTFLVGNNKISRMGKIVLLILSSIWGLKISLNISAWGMDWDGFITRTSNPFVDNLSWGILILVCIVLLILWVWLPRLRNLR